MKTTKDIDPSMMRFISSHVFDKLSEASHLASARRAAHFNVQVHERLIDVEDQKVRVFAVIVRDSPDRWQRPQGTS